MGLLLASNAPRNRPSSFFDGATTIRRPLSLPKPPFLLSSLVFPKGVGKINLTWGLVPYCTVNYASDLCSSFSRRWIEQISGIEFGIHQSNPCYHVPRTLHPVLDHWTEEMIGYFSLFFHFRIFTLYSVPCRGISSTNHSRKKTNFFDQVDSTEKKKFSSQRNPSRTNFVEFRRASQGS